MAEKVMRAPFDLAARRRARDRAARLIAADDAVLAYIEEELMFRTGLAGATPEGPELRLGLLRPPPAGAVAADPSFVLTQRHGGVQCDAERLPFADHAFARVTALMTLHGVNDLPGALVLFRRVLLPGGRLFVAMAGGFAFPEVREAFLAADVASGGAVGPRVGPTLDPSIAAGLLQRAGFEDPVAEVETLPLKVESLRALARDLERYGETGWLAQRIRSLTTPRRWAAAEALFAKNADADGRIPVTLQILYMTARTHVKKEAGANDAVSDTP